MILLSVRAAEWMGKPMPEGATQSGSGVLAYEDHPSTAYGVYGYMYACS